MRRIGLNCRSLRPLIALVAVLALALVTPAFTSAWSTGDFTDSTGSISFRIDMGRIRQPLTVTAYRLTDGVYQPVATVTASSLATEFPILPIGPYRLKVEDPSGWYRSGWWVSRGTHNAGVVTDRIEDASDVVVPPRQWARPVLDPQGTGSISGRVVDAETGEPVSGATIMGIGVTQGWLLSGYWAKPKSATDGTYVLEGLTPDTYTLVEYGPVVGGVRTYVNQVLGETAENPRGQSVEVTVGASAADRDFSVLRSGVITGRVIRETDGSPAVGAQVRAVQGTHPSGLISYGWGTATTDLDGRYVIRGLSSAPCTLTISGNFGTNDLDGTATTTVSAAATTTVPDVVLPVAASITGTATVLPVYYPAEWQGSRVILYRKNADGSFSQVRSTYLSHRGPQPFQLNRIAAGTYRLGFHSQQASARYWPDSSTLEGAQDIVLVPGSSAAVTQTVVSDAQLDGFVTSSHDGSKLSDMIVKLWQKQPDGTFVETASSKTWDWTTWKLYTGSAGTYRVTVEDPRGYYATLGWPDGTDLDSAEDISLEVGELLTMSPAMRPRFATVDVHVVEAGSGDPIPGAHVSAWRKTWTADGRVLMATASADASGIARFERLMPAEEYAFDVNEDAADGWHVTASVSSSVPGSSTISTSASMVRRGLIAGTVTEQGIGYPIPGALVFHTYWAGAPSSFAVCDELGRYLTSPLDPGFYWADVIDPLDEYTQASLAGAFAESGVTVQGDYEMTRNPLVIERAAGPSVYADSVVASQKTFDGADEVVLASGASFADGLVGAPLASALGGPVLLTGNASLPTVVADEIVRLDPQHITILGGEASVGKGVIASLARLGYGPSDIERIGGVNRYDTARKIAFKLKETLDYPGTPGDPMDPPEPYVPDRAFVVSGEKFPDALSASAVAADELSPILLARERSLPAETTSALRGLGIKRTIVVGGTTAVAATVARKLPKPTRVAGATRWATNDAVIAMAIKEGFAPRGLVVASGLSFQDAMVGGALAPERGALLLLVDAKMNSVTAASVDKVAPDLSSVLFIGGTTGVSSAVERDITTRVLRARR